MWFSWKVRANVLEYELNPKNKSSVLKRKLRRLEVRRKETKRKRFELRGRRFGSRRRRSASNILGMSDTIETLQQTGRDVVALRGACHRDCNIARQLGIHRRTTAAGKSGRQTQDGSAHYASGWPLSLHHRQGGPSK